MMLSQKNGEEDSCLPVQNAGADLGKLVVNSGMDLAVHKGDALMKSFFVQGEEQEKAKEQAYEMLKVLDNELKDKKYFVGDKFGFADIAATGVALYLGVLEEATGIVLATREKFPIFCAWRDEYCSENKEYLPPRDGLLAAFKALFQAAAAAAAAK